MRAASGEPALSGKGRVAIKAAGEGLSPASVLAAMEGTGTFALSGARLAGIDPAGFIGGLDTATSAADVDVLVDSTLRAGVVAVGDATVPLTVGGGVAAAAPVPVAVEGAEGALRVLFDLSGGLADLSANIDLKPQGKTLPRFELAWAGAPGALTASYDVGALKSAITVDALKRGVDQLEALQREQQRIVEEERAFAREQAIPFTEESVRRYMRARAAEDKRARDAAETRRQGEASAMRRIELDLRRAEEQERRRAEEERRRLQQQQAPEAVPPAMGQEQPLPVEPEPLAFPAPLPKPKPAPPATPPPVTPIGTPSVIPPIPGEAEVEVYVIPLPAEPAAQPALPAPPPKASMSGDRK